MALALQHMGTAAHCLQSQPQGECLPNHQTPFVSMVSQSEHVAVGTEAGLHIVLSVLTAAHGCVSKRSCKTLALENFVFLWGTDVLLVFA